MKELLLCKERLAELAAFDSSSANGTEPATRAEWQAMASALLASYGQMPVAEVVEGVDCDDDDQPLNQKHFHYSLEDIEALPVGTKLYAITPAPANNS